jgi:hypothetical protein
MPGTPVVLLAGVSGLPLSGADYNQNWGTIEQSFLDSSLFIILGLIPTPGSGLAVQVSSGTAVIGAHLSLAGFAIAPLVPNTLNYLYLQQNMHGVANTTGIPPANSVLLGTATTGANSVNSVNTGSSSGRQQYVRPELLIPGGPAVGITSAGHLGSINLSNWNASAGEGVAVYGTLPGGAVPSGRPSYAPVVTKTTTYTIVPADFTIRADATGGPFTLTLPSAVTVGAGFPFRIKKIDATANPISIASVGGQTFDGAVSPYLLVSPQQAIEPTSTGSNWDIY